MSNNQSAEIVVTLFDKVRLIRAKEQCAFECLFRKNPVYLRADCDLLFLLVVFKYSVPSPLTVGAALM